MPLVSVTRAKQALQIVSNLNDAEIGQVLEEAEDLIIGYLKKPNHGWTEGTLPPRVRSAILLATKSMFDDREKAEMIALLDQDGGIRSPIANLLRRDRDPAIA